MKKAALLFSAVLLGTALFSQAADNDPGYVEHRSAEGGGAYILRRIGPETDALPFLGPNMLVPLYYRPTMRYYGNGYTVNYRFVPVYKTDSVNIGAVGGSSNFRTEAFHMSNEEVLSWGANSPRMTVKDTRTAAPRTAVTSIVRKKTTTTKASTKSTGTVPAVEPTDAAPAPAPDAAPAPVPVKR